MPLPFLPPHSLIPRVVVVVVYIAGFKVFAAVNEAMAAVCACLCCCVCDPFALLVPLLLIPPLAIEWAWSIVLFVVRCLCRRTSIYFGGGGPGGDIQFPPIEQPSVMLQVRRMAGDGRGGCSRPSSSRPPCSRRAEVPAEEAGPTPPPLCSQPHCRSCAAR